MQIASPRSPEIDIARVAAILIMVAYHIAYDLGVLYGWEIDIFHGAWWIAGKTSAVLFLLLVGMSFRISWSRTPEWKKSALRGIRIFAYGLVVTAATYVFDPVSYVRFGILHLIGISVLLLPLFVRLAFWNVPLGAVLIGTGLMTLRMSGTTATLIFGAMPEGFFSIDYYPLLPWFGVVLIGCAFGELFLRAGRPSLLRAAPVWLTAISKHSLSIYMAHQPLILLLLRIILGPVR